jgi:hypothetical protein
MAYASAAAPVPTIRLPHVAMPKLHWPRFSAGTRAWLMIALMFSPAVLSDAIGYCVQHIFYTQAQIDARESPEALMAKIRMFDVACPAPNTPPAEQGRWATYAAEQGWPLYPPAGPGCFHPDRNLRGIVPLKVFTVACPKTLLSALERRHWLVYAADHDWTAYQQAGDGCVDP